MHISKHWTQVAVVSLLAAGVIGAVPALAADQCTAGGTLRMAWDEEPASIVPWISTGNSTIFLQIQLYDRLVDVLPGNPDVQPGLAKSWDVSPDGLVYTFKLRDAKFSNGDPVTAEDVKFSLDRMIDPKVQVGWNFLMPNIKGFEIVDPSTIQMTMKAVDASILYTLSLPAGGIVSKKAFETLGEEKFAENPVGSGPFVLKNWVRGQTLELERNPHYWNEGTPHLDGVTFLLLPDKSARILKIQSGEADIAQSIPFSQAKQLDAEDGITVQVEPYMVGFGVWLNNEKKPLDEKVVRQALNYATPKDIINEVVLSGLGTIQNSIIPPTRYWDPNVPPYPYDLAKAKELLSKSSVPDGFTLPIMVSSEDPESKQTAEIIQSEWAKIGVTVDIQPGDTSANAKKYWSGDYYARIVKPSGLSSDTPDDSEWAALVFEYGDEWKGFGTRFKSEEAASLARAARSTLDGAKRQELYSQLQRLGLEEAPQVPMLFSPTVTAVSDKVGGFTTLPVGWWRLEQACFIQ